MIGPTGVSVEYRQLDTGADDTVFPETVATDIGLNFPMRLPAAPKAERPWFFPLQYHNTHVYYRINLWTQTIWEDLKMRAIPGAILILAGVIAGNFALLFAGAEWYRSPEILSIKSGFVLLMHIGSVIGLTFVGGGLLLWGLLTDKPAG